MMSSHHRLFVMFKATPIQNGHVFFQPAFFFLEVQIN